jgi:hypothetical protein
MMADRRGLGYTRPPVGKRDMMRFMPAPDVEAREFAVARLGPGVTRTLLGVGVNPEDLPAGGALQAGPVPARQRAMMARGGIVIHRYHG